MYKLFAIMCFLINGEVQCTTYTDSYKEIFQELSRCEKAAEERFYGITDVFHAYNQPYERITIGCEEIEN